IARPVPRAAPLEPNREKHGPTLRPPRSAARDHSTLATETQEESYMAKTVVVLGARNLGGAIIDRFLELGWNAAGVAQSEDTLERVRQRGALALGADAADASSLSEALTAARAEFGSLDAVVNAVSAARPRTRGPFGGG